MAKKKKQSYYDKLKAAAKDLNEVIGFEDPIKADKKADLEKILVKAFTEVADPVTDTALMDETIALMEELGCDISEWVGCDISEWVEAEAEAEAEAGGGEEVGEEEEVDALTEKMTENKEFEEAAAEEAEVKERTQRVEEEIKKKAPVKKKSPTLHRSFSIIDAITKKFQDLNTVAEKGDELYVEAGGKPNIRQALHVTKILTKDLVYIGFAEMNKDGHIRKTK